MLSALIVTVAYNPPESIIQNLEIDFYPHMVVDNSEQETIWLRDYCAEHHHVYQWLGDNLGIAKALNVGAEYAIENGFDYIVTMDQDSELTIDILIRLSNYILSYKNIKQVALFSPRHINPSDTYILRTSEVENDIFVMTSGNFVNLRIWGLVGMYDEKLFIDMVDFDFNARAILLGYKVLTVNTIEMNQFVGNNATTKWIGKYGFDVWHHNKIRKYYQARNYNYIYSKYCNFIPEVNLIKKIIRKMPIGILLFESNKVEKIYYYFLGVFDFWRGKFGRMSNK